MVGAGVFEGSSEGTMAQEVSVTAVISARSADNAECFFISFAFQIIKCCGNFRNSNIIARGIKKGKSQAKKAGGKKRTELTAVSAFDILNEAE